jgi:hypothetical protein
MRRGAATLRVCCSILLTTALTVHASADEALAPHYDWRGFYLGAHLGGALSLSDVGDPFGASLYGDTVRSPGPIAGGQVGYNWQYGRGLIGIEADASWADLFGTETCFAYSGFTSVPTAAPRRMRSARSQQGSAGSLVQTPARCSTEKPAAPGATAARWRPPTEIPDTHRPKRTA